MKLKILALLAATIAVPVMAIVPEHYIIEVKNSTSELSQPVKITLQEGYGITSNVIEERHTLSRGQNFELEARRIEWPLNLYIYDTNNNLLFTKTYESVNSGFFRVTPEVAGIELPENKPTSKMIITIRGNVPGRIQTLDVIVTKNVNVRRGVANS